MPVTVFLTDNNPTVWEQKSFVTTAEELLKESCPEEAEQCTSVPEPSSKDLETEYFGPSCNGFVHAVCEAYSGHHHLKIRPDDVWLSILVQLSFYFDRNGDKFRYMLTVNEGWRDVGATDYATMEEAEAAMEEDESMIDGAESIMDDDDSIMDEDDSTTDEAELEWLAPTKTRGSKNVFDDGDIKYWENWGNWDLEVGLRNWIRPNFTTTGDGDRAIALAIAREFEDINTDPKNFIMPIKSEARQPCFNYNVSYSCGLPSVTLLGEREDWARLRDRLWEISTSHREEVEKFADQLETVLDSFVNSFDNPTGSEVFEFWNKMVHYRDGCSGTRYVSGWLSKFCFWSEEGEEIQDHSTGGARMIDTKRTSRGFASVVVRENKEGEMQSVKMLAGSIGHRITSSGDLLDQSGSYRIGQQTQTGLDTIQPVAGWWKCEHKESSPDIEE
ncbi:unnamed protein product [Clonostachys byssicola]|uniref:Uncharacterized protein n=1 Tax=Clonostachys byssicola TaxID=160290 RepID=A0A9N9Y1N8_9HYPO|nr:unnamed protein product [Clonostachys byssicola]